MSTTIDQKVVEMRFDNKHFESNAKETMSTLEKLKQKLNLTGASKGLENISTSANKVNMNGLGNALDTVHSKFSALEIMGVTALANITNSAVNAGKRMVESLTVAPIRDGFQEYEMTLNSIQTTMAGTGKTAKEVEEQLKRLDEYADKTVYSTADMLNNLPKFTNAGVELEKATTAMIGIANATALAGGDAGKASIAFYNLGQAIGTGYLTRMDYNSINNAGIATMEWKNQMVEAAIAAGKLKKVGEDSYQAGKKTFTLQQLFIDGLQEQWATTDVMMKVFEDYGNETTEIGKKSYSAAQDIKTFSMMMDSLKATAGTGWKDTWQIIFGDLDEAKEFWTGLTNFISGIISGMADVRNKFLQSFLGKSFVGVFENVKKSLDGIKNTVKTIKDYTNVVNEIIGGKWGNGQARWDKLTKSGYDWAHAQNLVNEKLGDGTRHATKFKEAQNGVAKSQKEAEEATNDHIIGLLKLTEAELKAKGYTDEQVKALKDLAAAADKTGIPIEEFIKNIDKIDGRYLLINSFKNAGQGLVSVFKAMKDAWAEIFPINGDGIFNAIAGLHKFSTYLTVSEGAADKLKRTFKGVFAILDIALTLIRGPIGIAFKIAFKLIEQLLKALDIGADGILGVTAYIGDAIVAFHDWLDSILDFTAVFEFLVPYLKQGATAVRDWFKSLKESEAVKKLTEYLKSSKDAIKEWFTNLKEAENIPKYIIDGLVGGLKNGAKIAIDAIITLGKGLLEGIKKILGIHSPSTEFFEIGKNIILGLINGIKEFAVMAYSLVMSVGTKIIEIVKNLDVGSILTILLGSGIAFSFITIAKAIDRLTSPFEGLNDIFEEAADTLQVFQGTLKSFSLKVKAEAIKTIAEAIAILAGSVAVLALLDQGKVWSAVGAVAALAAIMGVMMVVVSKFGEGSNKLESLSMGKIVLALIGLSGAMLIMSKVVKTIGGMEWEDMGKAAAGLAGLTVFITGLIAATKLITDKDISQLGKTLTSIAGAMLILSITAKLIAGMTWTDMGKAGVGLLALGGLITGLIAATKLITDKDVLKIGKMISSVAWAMLLLALTAKIIAGMTWTDMGKAGVGILAFSGIIVGLVAATKLVSQKDISKLGSTILGVAGAMTLMALTAKIIASMEWKDMAKAGVGLVALGGIVTGLIAATKLVSEKDLSKVGITLLMISASIALLAVSAGLLSLMSVEGLAKGIIAVGFLSVMMMGLIKATKDAQQCVGTMVAITVSIALLSIALASLSLIDTKKLLSATIALSTVLGVFSLVIKATGSMGSNIGMIITLTVVVAALAGVIYLLSNIPMERALAASAALSILLLSMSASLTIVSLMGPTAMQSVGILALLSLVVGGLGLIIVGLDNLGLGSAMDTVTTLSTMLLAMSAALVILTGVGMMGPAALIGIGSLAALIVGVGGLIMAIGALVTEFPKLEEFLNTGIPVLEKIGHALGSFFGNIIGGFLDGITNGLPQIGTDLSMFMMNAMPFITGAKLIDSSVLEGIKALADTVLTLTAANVIDGLTSWFTGGTSFVDFGKELAAFGPYMAQYAAAVAGINAETVVASANAAKALSEMANNIPNSGGLVSWFAGENDMNAFGTQLVTFGTKLKEYSIAVTGINIEAITASANAAKALGEMASAIPNMGGMVTWFTGDNDLATFGEKLVVFGTKLKEYSTKVDGINQEAISASVEAAKSLSDLASAIPNMGGVVSWFTGDNGLDTFGEKLVVFGQSLSDYNSKVSGINTETLSSSISSFNSLVNMVKNMDGVDFGSLGSFSNSLNKIGTDGVNKFIEAFKNAHSNATSAFKQLLDAVKKTGESKSSDFTKVGKSSVEKFSEGIKNNSKKAESAFKTVISNVIDIIKGKYDGFKGAGSHVVSGFANGITENTFRAEAAARAMAEAALEAARAALREHSPSRAFYDVGDYAGLGFVNALNDYGSVAYSSGYGMAEMAKNGLSKAITKVSDLINNGIDNQPTIRPVLDLTEVESGAGYLSSMFNNQSIGVMSNLRAISSGMDSRNQNGSNNDVVSAIDKLRKDLGNVGGNTYNINGVSANGDEAINNAINELIRVIKIERRT